MPTRKNLFFTVATVAKVSDHTTPDDNDRVFATRKLQGRMFAETVELSDNREFADIFFLDGSIAWDVPARNFMAA